MDFSLLPRIARRDFLWLLAIFCIVLLADAHIGRLALCQRLADSSRSAGLTALLDDRASLDKAVVPTELPKLACIPSFPGPGRTGHVLSASRLGEIAVLAASRFDTVIIAGPPVPAIDAVLLVADGSLQRRGTVTATNRCR